MIINAGGGGSGGGGGGSYSVLTVVNKSGSSTKTISKGSSLSLDFEWHSTVEGIETGDGTLTIKEGTTIKSVKSIKQGDITVDVTDYLPTEGSVALTLVFSDVYETTRPLIFNITVVELKLESSFDVEETQTGPFYFRYTPRTVGTKYMVIKVDGVQVTEEPIEITDVGIEHSQYISTMTHGSHTLEAYFTMTLNESTVSSNVLKYDVMYVTTGTDPVITSQFFQTTASQYDTVLIPYKVYTPDKATSTVILNDGKTTSTVTVDRNIQNWSVSLNEQGSKVLTIKSGNITKTFNITVTEVPGMPEAITENLELYLTSEGKSNADLQNRDKWYYGNYHAQFSNFGWVSDGWQTDSDNVTILKVAGDGRVYIPFYIFEKNFKNTGETIEIDFSTSNVTNYDSEVITCWSGDRGLKITPQKMIFQSEQTLDFSTSFKDEEHIRLSLVVQKWTEQRLIFCYINGIMSATVQYPDSDSFNQLNPVGITIGSNYADTNIYCIRVYNNNLSRFNILDNWIADTRVGSLKRTRFDRNDVIDKSLNKITPDKLPDYLPYMILNAEELPKTKPDPKIVSGSYTDRLNPDKSFTFTGASFDVQGTSSKDYSRKNYKAKFKQGFTINGEHQETYALSDSSIPVSTFCFKADVASSEGANNVELVNYYNQVSPDIPPKEEDPRVRHGIEGYPIAMFWNNGTTTTFLGKYNFNNDKSTNEVFGLEDGDESWEFLNNVSDMTRWKNDDFSGAWTDNVEARFPDENTEISNLKAFIGWVKSTDSTAATGESITPVTYEGVTYDHDTAAYRVAKFRDELEDWANVDALVFNYVFTEVFLMVDNRAKNIFPTKYQGDDKWYILPYDYDTALGCDNVGTLSFDYKYEYTDNKVIGDETSGWVYNDESKSVLFTNLRLGFPEEIKNKYAELASATTNKLCYDTIKKRFEDHQSKWGEAVFNEDAWYKYIQPLIDEGTTLYLPMVQGSKAEQRKWWLYNRFKYMDSKYNAGDAKTDRVLLRAYAVSDITVYPYADIYATVDWGGTLTQQRAFRNKYYTFNCPLPSLNDTEISIYSCSQLLSVGDLSGLKPRIADFTYATHLSEIKVGDSSATYENPHLTQLTVSNNKMLKKIDASNCKVLSSPPDASGCTNLEEAIFDGTILTGIELPQSGMLKKLHLPNTVKSLKVLNQPNITDLVLDTDSLNLTTLWLENNGSIFNQYQLIMDLASGGSVRVTDFDHTFTSRADIMNFINKLSSLNGLDEQGGTIIGKAQVFGTIRIDTLYDYDYKAIMAAKPAALDLVVGTILRTIKKLEVTGDWTKNQVVNEAVKKDGLTFTATWGDDETGTVDNDSVAVTPETWPEVGPDKKATFTYTINGTSASCEKTATVIRIVTELTVSDTWTKKQFYDTAPDVTELTFTAHYNDGHSIDVTDVNVTPEKWTGIGTQEATFTYSETYTEGITTVTCKKSTTVYKKLLSLTAKGDWTKPQFYNAAPDVTELTFEATYNYGDPTPVTEVTVTPETWTEVGLDKKATFTYSENEITVSCERTTTVYRKLESIYYEGEWGYQYYDDPVNITGITFKAHYNYGDDAEIIPVITPEKWTEIGTEKEATFTYTENGITATTVKKLTVVPKMTGFTVSEDWVKPQFYLCAPDISALTFTATYNYGLPRTIEHESITVTPETWKVNIASQTATFTYAENGITLTIEKQADVVRKLDNITFTDNFGYQYYKYPVNTDGVTFTIHYNNGDSQNIDVSLVTVTPVEWPAVGEDKWAEFSYTDVYGIRVARSKQFTVVPALKPEMTVKNDWENPQYVETPVDPTGLEFTAYFNDDTSKIVTPTSVEPESWTSIIGKQTAKFIYIENGLGASVDKEADVEDVPVQSLVHRTLAGISDDQLTKIGDYALAGCTNLKSVVVTAVTEIGEYAFYGCEKLTSIKLGTPACTLGANAFADSGITSSTGTIYVPSAYVDSYKAAAGWSEYANIIVGY